MGAGFHGGFGATKGYFEGNPAAGEIVFASADYDYINNIANRKDVDPDGLYDVVGHGTPYKIKFGDGDNDYYTPFQNNPRVVAKAYKIALNEFPKVFKHIEFAVYCGPRDTGNYDAFKEALG